MVNKKLSEEDKDLIYDLWLQLYSLSRIHQKLNCEGKHVALSTIQRVVQQKKRGDNSSSNLFVSKIFKHLKTANESLCMVSNSIDDEFKVQKYHEKQKVFLLKIIKDIDFKLTEIITSMTDFNLTNKQKNTILDKVGDINNIFKNVEEKVLNLEIY